MIQKIEAYAVTCDSCKLRLVVQRVEGSESGIMPERWTTKYFTNEIGGVHPIHKCPKCSGDNTKSTCSSVVEH